ncbi:MAG: sigma-54 interaction domain-containing protein, partial [Pseudomonadales bacterium]
TSEWSVNRFTVGILGNDSALEHGLAAALTLLGEHVTDPGSADGLFCVGEQQLPEHLAERPVVVCYGADDLVSLSSAENAAAAIDRISLPARRTHLERAVAALHRRLQVAAGSEGDPLPSIIGSSAGTMTLKHRLAQVAKGDSTVLLTGPSGTGKSFLAETIHRHSERQGKPFVPINCGAIPTELIESELFGHEKGAFTGALDRRLGRFDLASGGTLFLDEIGDMPYAMQVKLLRAIQERVFERVGGVETIVADVRIIAATNVDLEARIREGAFREDLFYRLNVFPVQVPSLAERREDLPALVDHFCEGMVKQYGYSIRLTEEAIERLQCNEWPGNLRELSNLIERLTAEHGDVMLGVDRLPIKYQSIGPDTEEQAATPASDAMVPQGSGQSGAIGLLPINGLDLKAYLAELEQNLIEQALRDTDAVVARAADRLHIRRTTLVEKMRKYGIDRSAH